MNLQIFASDLLTKIFIVKKLDKVWEFLYNLFGGGFISSLWLYLKSLFRKIIRFIILDFKNEILEEDKKEKNEESKRKQ